MVETDLRMNQQKLRQHIERVKRERAVTVTAPSGIEYRVVRTGIEVYLEGGRLPENFVLQLKRVARGEISPQQAQSLTKPEDEIAYAKFVARLVQESVIEPRIVTHATDQDGEIDIAELTAINDYEYLVNWITGLIPDQPVMTDAGETSVAALENFRAESERSVFAEPGGDSQQVQPATQQAAGN